MFLYEKDHIRLIPGSPDKIKNTLTNGLYVLDITNSMEGPIIKFKKNTDYSKGIVVKGGPFDKIRTDVNAFLSEEQKEARQLLGMKNKVGLLLDGDPGTGKTFLACQIGSEICESHDAIAIVTNTLDVIPPEFIIDNIRDTLNEPDKLIIFIMDEFEKSRAKWSSDMLSFLDGANSRDNVIVMATVNDTDELPATYTNRPGRFEKTYDFSITNKEVLRSIVTQTLPDKYKELFDIDALVERFSSQKPKFGLSGGDNVTIDKVKIVLRNMIAENIKETKKKKEIVKAISPN